MTFPFDAVVGLDDAKLALKLTALDPRIGGVLLRGQKGSAKTTLARGFAAYLGDAPFVELPLGATEDRVVGSIDVHAALVDGEARFQPGLLAAVDGGVLYVDEINLLPDHVVDILLDVAVSGENLVERDGISHRHPARFVLVGSMNPEEGELCPQLLDRFGLCVNMEAPRSVEDRVESVRRRLVFDRDRELADLAQPEVLPRSGIKATIDDDLMTAASRLALSVGAEGLRADLVLCRSAAAHATMQGRQRADVDDLRRVAPLVLAHRSRRGPFDPPVIPPEALQEAIDTTLDSDDEASDDDYAEDGGEAPDQGLTMGTPRRPPVAPADAASSSRGRTVGHREAGSGDAVAVMPTVRALAARRTTDRNASLDRDDLRTNLRVKERGRTIVFCVDLSGSMGAPERAAGASGTVLGLLGNAYENRHRVALVGFRDTGAEVILAPTSSVEIARNRLGGLTTGGETPLAAGIETALTVAESAANSESDGLIVLLTDGRATGSPNALDRAIDRAALVRRRRIPALVLDCEMGTNRLDLAARIAEAMDAPCIRVTDLDSVGLSELIRTAL
jgi:magnesium chelatase subunit D